MIDVHTADTPNGIKVPIALVELGVSYRILKLDLEAKEQKRPAFLAINPNGRIPAIVDHDGPGGVPLNVFESGAILLYLAESRRGLLPSDPVDRVRMLEYTFFQVGGIGPMFGQAGWFARSAPEHIDFAIKRYTDESRRLAAVLERRLQQTIWLAGSTLSSADIMNFGWLPVAHYAGVEINDFPATADWVARIAARPSVVRALQRMA